MDAAFTIRPLVSNACLVDPAGDRIGDELFVPLAPRPSMIDLRNRLTGLGKTVGIDPGKRADAAGRSPGAGALAIRHRDALAAFHERQHLASGDHERIERFHRTAPCGDRPAGSDFAAAVQHAPLTAPPAARIWGTSENTEVTPQPNNVCARAKSLTV